jgi:2-O-methyltransferase
MNIRHFTDEGYKLHGVVHVGAHEGGEIPLYQELGLNILCFEPLDEAVTAFKLKYPDVKIEKLALGDKNGMAYLNVSGDGAFAQASSLLNFKPENYGMTGDLLKRQLTAVARFDTYAEQHDIDPANYDTLVIDTQGSEMDVLGGFGPLIRAFDFLLVECSEVPLYEGGAPAADIIAYLADYDFDQDSPTQRHEDIAFVAKGVTK